MSTVYIRFPAQLASTLVRAPLLERLLARGEPAAPVVHWRDDAFRVIGGAQSAPAVAAAALCASHGTTAAAWVCLAAPVHLVAGMRDVTLHEDGVLALDGAEATALANDFNRVFEAGDVRLWVGRGAELLLTFDRPLEVVTHEPAAVVGRELYDFQAAGRDAATLRRLGSEIEMWLFEHAVNGARSTRGAPPVTGLWPWGGGMVLESLPRIEGWCAGADPLFATFDSRAEFPREAGAGVVVASAGPASAGWAAVERQWLAPALGALRARRIERLELSSGTRGFTLTRAAAGRFWRRPVPWWEACGESHGLP